MSQDEISVMDGGKCILQVRGARPFFSDKFDITKHPRYKFLSDFDKKNEFDIEKYLKRRPETVKPDERLNAGVCELCGKRHTDLLEVHVIRNLTELGNSDWKLAMKAKRRKTLVVCPDCHTRIHS